jgi:hypothetical protein
VSVHADHQVKKIAREEYERALRGKRGAPFGESDARGDTDDGDS